MPRRKLSNIMRRWKMERAHVHGRKKKVERSNKYSSGDREAAPKAHQRKQTWVGGYIKRDGTKIKGYYRANSQYRR